MTMLNEVIGTAKGIDPLTLAILFIGLVSLGAIWLASVAIRASSERRKK